MTSIDRVAPNTAASTLVPGAPTGGRSCTIKGFGETDERITAFDASNRTLEYSVTSAKVPASVRDMRNHWQVRPTGASTCEVRSRISAEATGLAGVLLAPMLRRKLRSTVQAVLVDLVTYAETGQPAQPSDAR